jgi:hypothetical protein
MYFKSSLDKSFIFVFKKTLVLFSDEFSIISMINKDGFLKTYTLQGKTNPEKYLRIQVVDGGENSSEELIITLKYGNDLPIVSHELITNEIRFIQL